MRIKKDVLGEWYESIQIIVIKKKETDPKQEEKKTNKRWNKKNGHNINAYIHTLLHGFDP